MTSTLSKILIFAAGLTVGSAVTWKILKKKYERLATEEIELALEKFSKLTKKLSEDIPEEEPKEESQDELESENDNSESEITEFEDKITQLGYADYSSMSNNRGGIKSVTKPRVITPEEFDMEDEYEIVSLSYYTDGVLADEFGNIIDDVDGTVGCDSLNHFGDYENDPDCVYVKNDELRTVYEILLTSEKYHSDNTSQRQVNDE